MTDPKETIFIISNEPWGDVWFSKQHYAHELNKLGYKVYFVNPATKWQFGNIFRKRVEQESTPEGLTILTYKNQFPQFILPRLFTRLNDRLNSKKLDRVASLQNERTIIWNFDPYRFLQRGKLKGHKRIYHAVDPYYFLWQDRIQASGADLIISTNPAYHAHYQTSFPDTHSICIPHGISEDEFEVDNARVAQIREECGNFVVLIGSITKDLNTDLLLETAEADCRIVIVGAEHISTDSWAQVKQHKNVHYLGVAHAKQVKHYIAASKSGLIGYHFKPEVDKNSRTPLKAIHYLAQRKPVITSFRITIPELENEGIYFSSSTETFILNVQKALEGKLAFNSDRNDEYMEKHKYPKLINRILSEL